ncbi:MAG: aspartate-semialdehyde dehydrogenase [Caldisericia bacterium]|jgi:aspartate-semialdehyde dehydrogenase|nr:aspartate-semialdehyde dehydrogenase [Caldisericia bacterium]
MVEVAILGATGIVGQRFISILQNHPFFKIKELCASENKKGRRFLDSVDWLIEEELNDEIKEIKLKSINDKLESKIIFSALPKEISFEIEDELSKKGYYVFSNSSSHRYDKFVPILIPEVNLEHIESIKFQKRAGFIVTNPNCTTTGIAIPLKPIKEKLGIKRVLSVSMQAISGAGVSGLPSMKIINNIIPYIENEEEKIEIELRKILGKFTKDGFLSANFDVEARCNRVPIRDGHMIINFVETDKEVDVEKIKEILEDFKGEPQKLNLPTSPKKVLRIFDEQTRPQPILDSNIDKGMSISIGRIKKSSFFTFTFTSLVHNTIRGAAGGSVLNAEILYKLNYIKV